MKRAFPPRGQGVVEPKSIVTPPIVGVCTRIELGRVRVFFGPIQKFGLIYRLNHGLRVYPIFQVGSPN